MRAEQRDIVVLGGGPAGAFAAHALKKNGYDVALVDPDRTPSRIEGVSPRVVAVLTNAGIDAGALSLTPPVERRSLWMGTASSANAEHLVDRADFDSALRKAATATGVVFHQDMTDQVTIADRGVSVLLASGQTIEARLAVDARGRRAPRPPKCARGPSTISASGWFRSAAGHDQPRTTVIPTPNGWVWVAEPGDGRCWVQVAFDASSLEGAGDKAVAKAMNEVLASDAVTDVFGPAIEPFDKPLVRACEMIFAGPKLTPPVVRIGDAATGLDPLSGHGMFWAVSSALSAVPIVHALLGGDAQDAELAHRFYNNRVRDTFFRQARVGRDFFRLETRWQQAPFWAGRREWPDLVPTHETTGEVSVSRAVVVENGRLKEADVLITPMHPGGVAWVAGVPIVSVFNKYLRPGEKPISADALDKSISSDTTPAQAKAVLAWLQQHQLVAGASARAMP